MARPLTWAIVLILFLGFIFLGQMCAYQLREVGKLALNQPVVEVSTTEISGSLSQVPVANESKAADTEPQNLVQPKTFWQRITGLFQISSPQKSRQDQLRQKVRDGEIGPREAAVKMYQNQA